MFNLFVHLLLIVKCLFLLPVWVILLHRTLPYNLNIVENRDALRKVSPISDAKSHIYIPGGLVRFFLPAIIRNCGILAEFILLHYSTPKKIALGRRWKRKLSFNLKLKPTEKWFSLNLFKCIFSYTFLQQEYIKDFYYEKALKGHWLFNICGYFPESCYKRFEEQYVFIYSLK